jgi:hypothetical protein
MSLPRHRVRSRSCTRLGIAALGIVAIGCAGGQEVTPETVDHARRLWAQAQIADYDLDWTVRGPNNAHYVVTVRGGQVRKIEAVERDGGKHELRPAESRFYSVDGLFLTISDELALVRTDRPFGQPKGTRVAMRFQPDAAVGYPHWYRRDVLGTPLSIAIEVNRLIPVTASAK